MNKLFILILSVLIFSCNDKKTESVENDAGILPVEGVGIDKPPIETKKPSALVLTTNALQLLNEETGSSTDLLFGMELDQVVDIINTTIDSKFKETQINARCGEGPLNMASWENGLVLTFQENKITKNWEFAGWVMEGNAIKPDALTTISGIGIGSSFQELEEAYETEVKKTSNGNQFTTSNGLHGILSGEGKDAEIKVLWSGITCI